MRKFLIVLVAALTLMLSAPVDSHALWGGSTTNNYYTDNSVENKGGKGGDATATIEEGAVKNNNFNTNLNTNVNDNVNVNKNDNKNTNTNVNTNFNTNKNENNNVNVQGQHQGQVQGQVQGQGQMQGNVNTIKIEAEEYKRNLPGIGGGSAYAAPDNPHLEKAGKTPNYGTAQELMEIRKTFSLGELDVLSGQEGSIDIDVRAFASRRVALDYPAKGLKGMDMKATITFTTEKPDGKAVGLFVAEGDTETDGIGVLAHAAIEAIRHGATTLYITRNDFVKVLEASHWGIMVGGGGSTIINDGGTNSSGASIAPGVGYGSAQSAYGLEPSVRAYGFR